MDEAHQSSSDAGDVAVHDVTATILAARGKVYGEFADHALIVQRLKDVMHRTSAWSGVLMPKGLEPMHKEALDMIAHKIGRILNGDPNYPDNWDDIAGYARLVADRVRK